MLVKMDHEFTFFFLSDSISFFSSFLCGATQSRASDSLDKSINKFFFFFFLCISAFMLVSTVASCRCLEFFNVMEMKPASQMCPCTSVWRSCL